MKKQFLKLQFIIVLFLLLGIQQSCTVEDDGLSLIEEVENIMQTENGWEITLFMDSEENETYLFSDYTFVFKDNGTLTASTGSNTFDGTWSITDSDSYDDDDGSSDDVDFNISFNLDNNLDELTDDWDIITKSENKIELIDISGDGDTEYLSFEKL